MKQSSVELTSITILAYLRKTTSHNICILCANMSMIKCKNITDPKLQPGGTPDVGEYENKKKYDIEL